ncbi:MAG TPA: ATP synthase F1 subunit delta [Dehalococcoidia bacterium]|nr:ATP synthase F1 subunit delta [Dehalococcoidia bacterium]
MLKGAVAKRYAQALFDVAKEQRLMDQFLVDLADLSQILSHPALIQVLDNPKIPFQTKRDLVRRLLGERSPYFLTFVDLAISKERASVAGQIRDAYQRLVNADRGIEVAEVTTAVPLDEDDKQLLARRLSDITGKKVLLELKVNPDILGGLVARIGDRVIDGSVISKLKALRAELAGAR